VANQAAIALGLTVVHRLLQGIEHEVRAHWTADPPGHWQGSVEKCLPEGDEGEEFNSSSSPRRVQSNPGPRRTDEAQD